MSKQIKDGDKVLNLLQQTIEALENGEYSNSFLLRELEDVKESLVFNLNRLEDR